MPYRTMNKIVLFTLGVFSCHALAQNSPSVLPPKEKIEIHSPAVALQNAEAVVLDEVCVVEYEFSEDSGFSIVQKVKRVIQINKKEGISHASLIVPFYSGRYAKEEVVIEYYKIYRTQNNKEEVLVIDRASNKKVDNEFYVKEIKEDDIQVGDRIEYSYTKTIDNIDGIPTWYFQEDIPKLKSSYTVMIPDNLTYLITKTGDFAIQETKKVTQTARNLSSSRWGTSYRFKEAILKFSAVNIPAFEYEPFRGNTQNNRSSIRFDLIQFQYPMEASVVIPHEPVAVAKEIYKNRNFGPELRQEKFWNKNTENLELEGLNEKEKTAKITAFIQNQIKWNQQYGYAAEFGVKKAFNQGLGNGADINLALIGALRAGGLVAEPIVLSTLSNGIASILFSRFINHVIVGVKIENQFYLIDGTMYNAQLNLLPFEDLNGPGWMITDQYAVTKVDLVPKQLSFRQEEFSLNLDTSGTVSGSMQTKLTRYEALAFQSKYTESAVNRSRRDIESRTNQFFLSKGEILPVNTGDIDLQFQVQKFNFATVEQKTAKMEFNPMQLYRDQENPFLSETRQFDIDFVFPFMDIYKVIVQIPEDYKVQTLPADEVFTSKKLGVNITYESKVLEANKIQVGFSFRLINPLLSKEDYEELQLLYAAMNQKMKQSIVLEKIK